MASPPFDHFFQRMPDLLPSVFLVVVLGSCGPKADNQASEAQSSVTIAVPPADPLPEQAAASEPAPNGPGLDEQSELRNTANVADAPAEPPESAATASDQNQEPVNSLDATATASDTEPPTAVSGKLPLPNAVIARTIERIGYSCGRVAAISPIEGSPPNVYKVTCTSGASYRAGPVNGRYRFRRLSNED